MRHFGNWMVTQTINIRNALLCNWKRAHTNSFNTKTEYIEALVCYASDLKMKSMTELEVLAKESGLAVECVANY